MKFVEIIATVIVAAGGTGSIIWLMSKSMAKGLFERYMEDVKHKYEVELNNLQSRLSTLTHISNIQYEKEFEIYQAIWKSMYDCIIKTKALYPQGLVFVPQDKEELKMYKIKKYEDWAHSYNTFMDDYISYEILLNDELNDKFSELRMVCSRVGAIFEAEELLKDTSPTFAAVKNEPMLKEEFNFVYRESHKEIERLRLEIKNIIKESLKKLRNEKIGDS